MDHVEAKMMQDTVKAVGLQDKEEQQKLFRKQKVLRFKFDSDFITDLTSFLKFINSISEMITKKLGINGVSIIPKLFLGKRCD